MAKPSKPPASTPPKAVSLPPDPFSPENIRKLALRIGIPALVLWGIAFLLNGAWPKVVMGVLTVLAAGLFGWAYRYAKKTRAIAQIVRGADTEEGRKQALSQLEAGYKKGDTAAVFARAQLEMQTDMKKALTTLEQINLDKVLAPIADEARSQRAMIHLVLGETDEARALVDKIDLNNHKEPKSRAMVVAVVAEAWARTGQAKRAIEILEKIDIADATFDEVKPQLLRAAAFAHAWGNDTKQMRAVLRKLSALNPQFLTGFITKKKNPAGVNPRGVHPLLEKEAFEMVMKSGLVQRRMEYRQG